MVSAKGIYYNSPNTQPLLEINPKERPVSLQLFGADPDIISEMAARIEELPFDILTSIWDVRCQKLSITERVLLF